MTGITDLNIVIGQGNAVNEVHNIRKQSLEFNQQFIAQDTELKKNIEKTRIQKSETENSIEIKKDEKKENNEDFEENQKDSKKNQTEEQSDQIENKHLIDIRI